MPTPQEIIAAAVKELHPRLLKPQGFRKNGKTWIRPGDWTSVIQIQLSAWNDSDEAKFTINVGIHLPGYKEFTGTLKPHHCWPTQARLGKFMDPPGDKWWSVTRETDPAALTDELARLLSTYALPWFESYESIAAGCGKLRTRVPEQVAAHLKSAG
ncbi:MAG: hypothetical protein JWO82_1634 [Akkermansiaceae bacterium]|nr:hypothetical protein [Akkermansiaceae bacterium]